MGCVMKVSPQVGLLTAGVMILLSSVYSIVGPGLGWTPLHGQALPGMIIAGISGVTAATLANWTKSRRARRTGPRDVA